MRYGRLVRYFSEWFFNSTHSRQVIQGPVHGHNQGSKAYLQPGRLEDVLAFIQVLGLDDAAHRNEGALQRELCGRPESAPTWCEVAEAHREFFRAYQGKDGLSVSLVARHVAKGGENEGRKVDSQFVRELVRGAIELHGAQIQRRQIRRVALGGALIFLLSNLHGIIQGVMEMIKYFRG